jgi:hypothetical protein
MTAGEPVQKIVLRDGDLLVEFQEVFNTFLTSGPWLDAQKVGAENQTEPGSQEAAVLASVAALDADLNSQPTEPAVAR